MKKLIKQSGVIIVICCLVGMGITCYQWYIPHAFSGPSTVITIPKGSTPHHIAEHLEQLAMIRSKSAFLSYYRFIADAKPLRAGTFLVSPAQSISQLIRILQTNSGRHALVKVTIPEGYNIWEIARRLEKKGISDYDTISHYLHHQAKSEFKSEFPFLKTIPVDTLEGYLYPETYYIPKDDGLKTITRLMLKEFQSRIMPLWENDPGIKGSPKSRFNIHQVLTIASLIEKEARLKTEMPIISSVFYNRLKKRMQLAADPTVVYALGKSYKDKVYYKDTRIDSPYNTYRYTGFMPSPIASVSVRAFGASLKPKQSQYLFFVANRDGSHTFTQTYRDHLNAQQKRM